jgi:deoxycytidylate deaminase
MADTPLSSDQNAGIVLDQSLSGELYFATVRAIGTPLHDDIVKPLEDALNGVNFHFESIRLSDRFFELDPVDRVLRDTIPRPEADAKDRYQFLMDSGDYLRALTGRSDALVLEAIRHLRDVGRSSAQTSALNDSRRGVAYLFRNLMHPDEAKRLRKLYRRQLFIISVFSSEDHRRRHLTRVFSGTDGQHEPEQAHAVSLLMSREHGHVTSNSDYDRLLVEKKAFRLNIGKTFEHGDLFVDVQEQAQCRAQIARFVDLIFGHPFHTPTPDEIGMADAFSAALHSGNLARPVGAAICTEDGDLITTGTNDVPKAGGGVYRSTDDPDNRDWKLGRDSSDSTRRNILKDLVQRLVADPTWLTAIDALLFDPIDGSTEVEGPGTTLANALRTERARRRFRERHTLEELTSAIISSPVARDAQFFDVIEYGRTLHAEMDAITSAARKGVSLKDSTLYCTTFPCHECARLIIGSGIKRVIFIEPYLKSRVAELYETEVRFTSLADSRAKPLRGKVDFVPYVGVSPKRFHELFSWVHRKAEDLLPAARRQLSGAIVDWDSNKTTSEVRDSIISAKSMTSPTRLQDLHDHENELVVDYQTVYSNLIGQQLYDDTLAPD